MFFTIIIFKDYQVPAAAFLSGGWVPQFSQGAHVLEHALNEPIGNVLSNYTFPNESGSLYLKGEVTGLSPSCTGLVIFITSVGGR